MELFPEEQWATFVVFREELLQDSAEFPEAPPGFALPVAYQEARSDFVPGLVVWLGPLAFESAALVLAFEPALHQILKAPD